MSPRYGLFRSVMILLGRALFGFTVHGAEKAPTSGPLIVASNHRRYADPVLVCMAVPRRFQWMAKKELFVPPLDRFFYFIGSFPVDRQKGGRAALKSALNLLSDGWALGIFPEGTRRKKAPEADAESVAEGDAPKGGVTMLAARANTPILPVFVGEVPNPLQRLRGKKLHVYVGNPIRTNNTTNGVRSRGSRSEAAGEVLRAIYALEPTGGNPF